MIIDTFSIFLPKRHKSTQFTGNAERKLLQLTKIITEIFPQSREGCKFALTIKR